jgi:hypothetical protein
MACADARANKPDALRHSTPCVRVLALLALDKMLPGIKE